MIRNEGDNQMKKTLLLACLMIIGFTIQNFSTQSVEQYRTREEIPARYKWDLRDIYKDWQAWNRARDEFIKVYGRKNFACHLFIFKNVLIRGVEKIPDQYYN